MKLYKVLYLIKDIITESWGNLKEDIISRIIAYYLLSIYSEN
jgi:hypothetical protein